MLVLMPDTEGGIHETFVAAEGATVEELKNLVHKMLDYECVGLVACSRGVVQDDQSTVVTSQPAVYSLCDRGSHSWTVMLTCTCRDSGVGEVKEWKQKMQSSDRLGLVKQALHRAWRIFGVNSDATCD